MEPDLRRLRAAVCVAEELSFSRAAERANITQPALSSQIANLEKELGFSLFDRSTRRVSVTSKGEQFVREARRVVQQYERLIRAAKALRKSDDMHVSIGTAIYTIDFEQRKMLIENLIEQCPELDLEIITTGSQTELIGELNAGRVDMAILMGIRVSSVTYSQAAKEQLGREILYPDNLRTRVLDTQAVDLLVPVESALSNLESVSAADLEHQSIALIHLVHGQQIHKPLMQYLENANATVITPPEHNAIGVERYGRKFRVPAITLGWFPQPPDQNMVRIAFSDLELETSLSLVTHPEFSTLAVERVFDFVESLFSH